MGIRVVVCYTGGVGSQALRLLAAEPGMEIVGVLVHHEEKDGRDVGELVGIGPIGLAATRDVDALVALRADCMLWHGLTWEPAVIARFLAAGTNVYSSMGGWWPAFIPADQETLAAACAEGGSTFLAGGNIPGLVSDVLPLFVSGYAGQVEKIRCWQSDYVPHYPAAQQLQGALGMGLPVPEDQSPTEADQGWIWGIRQSAEIVAAGLGFELVDVKVTKKEYAAALQDTVLHPSGLDVRKGTIAGARWTFTAYTGADGDVPFYEVVNEQTVGLGLAPGWRVSEDEPNWKVEITGVPTITCVFDLAFDPDLEPVSALNAARAVNAIPILVAAEPGTKTVLDLPAPRAATLAARAKPAAGRP
ncbi:dihydrodipicolinate reductase [Frankia sp. AgB1.9]|uniref:dihydrodipicolinate reductase n=1 Tax=unclassified Frankia TaxID=2632575 RepID=UPI0019327B1A|nr:MULTISPECIES: dihydrodipicolinate reductase [unclassified Frankia]MBL7491724.1 dihydrodipicolinate reductase [Frankia sp. AgW1.1]MBL7550833.1 dihydrodipicolinate reductase [Frankia sp. AgB1.9]MBL7625154.1 dihydrodipicolinate reductase [Frankia sp. AgB1.8]